MAGQINFITQMQEQDWEEKRIEKVREHYQMWLKAPDMYFVPDEKREEMKTYPLRTGYDIFGATVHICNENDGKHRIWLNIGERPSWGGEYWVMNENDNPAGELIQVCPFCKANLCRGEGRIALEKNHQREEHYNSETMRQYYGFPD